MQSVDLHAHSSASDGLLSPASLIHKAVENGVGLLALTDHDVTTGIAEARAAAAVQAVRLVPGVEISVTWRGKTVHVLGLAIDPSCELLQEGLASVRSGRRVRAERIAAELSRVGFEGTFEGAARHAGNVDFIGRMHFARYLVECGKVSEVRDVFRRYLSEGRPGFVPHEWASLDDAVAWIHAAGGEAVIAHPARYDLGSDGLRQLAREFRDAGGTAVEVIAPSQRPAEFVALARLCHAFGFKGSVGSDYHGPGEQRLELGRLPVLPYGITPIWESWSLPSGFVAH